MKRLIDYELRTWSTSIPRKPLVLRGARQVGKTHAVRELGNSFPDFVEINFELMPEAIAVFEKDLDPDRIIIALSVLMDRAITPGKTLLFLDEIQMAPKALIALRYFYEKLPALHVVAAGSLLDFGIKKVGIPVGRVLSLYMYPMTFMEFIYALDKKLLIEEILKHDHTKPMSETTHSKAIELYALYLAIGGMPEAVMCWKTKKDPLQCALVHHALIDTYRQDFSKYAEEYQIKYVELLFEKIPRFSGKGFKYSAIEGDYRKRDLEPCLELLSTAGIIQRVYNTDARGIPLGAEVDERHFKVIFIDTALAQAILGLNMKDWFLNPLEAFVNKGPLVEACVGQELLAYAYPHTKSPLYFWQNLARSSEAEIDYLVQHGHITPIEVKSGKGTTLFSMHAFLKARPNIPYGIRLSVHNYSVNEKIHSYPLYALATTFKSYAERVVQLISE